MSEERRHVPNAAVAYIERSDGQILCVWNKRFNGWSMPGGLVEDNETIVNALARELREETGMTLESASLVFVGPHKTKVPTGRGSIVNVFRVTAIGQPEPIEGCPVSWMTRELFLEVSPFRDFYADVFAGPLAP